MPPSFPNFEEPDWLAIPKMHKVKIYESTKANGIIFRHLSKLQDEEPVFSNFEESHMRPHIFVPLEKVSGITDEARGLLEKYNKKASIKMHRD